MQKCFLCLKGNVKNGICDNPKCPRHKPLNPPKNKEESV